jgi:hypothetical protein
MVITSPSSRKLGRKLILIDTGYVLKNPGVFLDVSSFASNNRFSMIAYSKFAFDLMRRRPHISRLNTAVCIWTCGNKINCAINRRMVDDVADTQRVCKSNVPLLFASRFGLQTSLERYESISHLEDWFMRESFTSTQSERMWDMTQLLATGTVVIWTTLAYNNKGLCQRTRELAREKLVYSRNSFPWQED